jgi:DNA polymerase
LQKKVITDIYKLQEAEMEDSKEILNWYIAAGVDTLCAETTQNFLQPKEDVLPKDSVPVSQPTNLRPATTLLAQTPDSAYINAQDICAKAQTLDDLRYLIENFEGCALKFSANSTVFGYGNPKAEVMIIGEAPGADEDRIGEPFVGRSGHLLDKILQAVGLNRDDCYITNVLPWRPPGNRTPTDSEVAVCLPFLQRQIELVDPKIILLLGGSAAKALLNTGESISQLRGRVVEYVSVSGKIFPTLSSYHPAYLLRTPSQKGKVWVDMLRLVQKLAEI